MDHALGLGVDLIGKAFFIPRLDHAVAEQFGTARNGVQGGLQFVGNIGGKLAAQALGLFPLGHIHDQQRHARKESLGKDRVGLDAVLAAVFFGNSFGALAPAGGQQQVQHGLGAVQGQNILAGIVPIGLQHPGCRGIHGQYLVLFVEQHQAFIHVVGDGLKFPAPLVQHTRLFAYFALLAFDAVKQRSHFVIPLVGKGMVQVQLVEGLHDFFGKTGGQHQTKHRARHHHNKNRPEHLGQQRQNAVLGHSKAQHAAVGQALSGIAGLFHQSIGVAHTFPKAAYQRFGDFLTLVVVGQAFGRNTVIVQHGAVGSHPGDAALLQLQLFKVAHAILGNALGGKLGLLPLLLLLLADVKVIQNADDDRNNSQHCPKGRQTDGTKNSFCHAFSSRR